MVDECAAGLPLPRCQRPQPTPSASPSPARRPPAAHGAAHGAVRGAHPIVPPKRVGTVSGRRLWAPGPATGIPAPGGPGDGSGLPEGGAGCSLADLGGCVEQGVNSFFRGLITAALNPLLDLLARTLLTTPTPDSMPALGQLWAGSWQILLASYALLIVVAGVLVMSYQTLQTRYSIKEIAPRIVVGFLAGSMSQWVATRLIELANSVSQAVMAGGLDPNTAAEPLRNLVLGVYNGGFFEIFVGLLLLGMVFALIIGWVVRVALTVILIAGAPIALMFHALPHTETIAYWWWRAFIGCLAIQIVQSLTLITSIRIFLAPDGFTLFGPTDAAWVRALVAIALMYILYKIPFWVLHAIRGGAGRRSLIGSLIRGFVAYKTFGLLAGRNPRRAAAGPAGNGARNGGRGRAAAGNTGGNTPDLFANPRTTREGQYLLPIDVRRTQRPHRPSRPAMPARSAGGRQLTLPLGADWPENTPVLGRDGQYRLPIPVTRPPPRPARTQPGSDAGNRTPARAGATTVGAAAGRGLAREPTRPGPRRPVPTPRHSHPHIYPPPPTTTRPAGTGGRGAGGVPVRAAAAPSG